MDPFYDSLKKSIENGNRIKILELLKSKNVKIEIKTIKSKKDKSIKIIFFTPVSGLGYHLWLEDCELIFIMECIQNTIDFNSRLLNLKKQTQLLCVKQTLFNLCCIYSS